MTTRIFPKHERRHVALGWIAISLLCSVSIVGCGSKASTIQGSVTLDGEPLEGVQVLFDQPEATDGKSFAGKTDELGVFVLSSVGGGETPSEVGGSYRVSLTTAVAARDATEHTPLPPERIPKQYRNGALDFQVPTSGTDAADFELTSRRK